MEEHYIKDVGKITYVYGVNLEEHKTVIEKQQKRIAELEKQLDQLKQQLAETEQKFLEFQEDSIRNEQIYVRELAEKQNTIDEINKEFVQAVHDWKALCAEKDKEIEHLKDAVNMCQSIKRYDIGEMLIENAKLKQNQTQLAIQELEKVKNKCNGMYELWLYSNYKENMYDNEDIAGVFEDISVFTNDLIKKLKGE